MILMLDNQHGTYPEMTMQETEDLRDKLTLSLQDMRRRKALRVTVYVEGKYRDSYEIAKKWAHEKKLTKRPTDWAFCKFAITNTIRTVLEEAERERNAPPEQPEDPETPQEPNIA
jgi:hypothetical protein